MPKCRKRCPSRREFAELDETDYFVLKHHQEFGMDYSIVVCRDIANSFRGDASAAPEVKNTRRIEAG